MKNELALVSWISYSEWGTHLNVEIEVDGNPLVRNFEERQLAINIPNLLASQSHVGEWYIVTCVCGEPACALIDDGIEVRHENESLYWTVNSFLPVKVFRFDYRQYCEAIAKGIEDIRELLSQAPNAGMDDPVRRYFYPRTDRFIYN